MARKLITCFATVVLCFLVAAPAAAVGPTPTPPAMGGSAGMPVSKPMTDAQRQAAAVRVAKARLAAGGAIAVAIPGTNKKGLRASVAAAAVPTGTASSLGVPDYFGNVPNYANSPIPTSVSIQGDGQGAFATATVNPDGTIGGITLVNGGSGYTFANVVVIGGGGSGATGTATVTAGTIVSINVTLGGSYTSPPSVTFSGGVGSGAAATSTLTPTSVQSLRLTSGGSRYAIAPRVTLSGTGIGARATATLASKGVVGAVNVSRRGSGYTRRPTVTLTGGGGTGATAIVTALSPVGIGAILVTNAGSCRTTTAPTVTITSANGAGTGATARATVGGAPRRVIRVTITNRGSGYTLPPVVRFVGTSCKSVAATARLRPTSVRTITVGTVGKGYTSAPRVRLSGGGGTGASGVAVIGRPVASLRLSAGGSGYTVAPTVTIAAPSFSGGITATATATIMPTSVASVTVTAPGSYTVAPTVGFSGGGAPPAAGGAEATAVLGSGISAIALTNPGSGYGSTPGIRKFVDSLPQLGAAGANDLGQYLPVAVADATSFPGSGIVPAADYYEIAVIQYTQKLHADLPATTLRGYVQIETPTIAAIPGASKHVQLFYPGGVTPILDNSGAQVYAVDNPQYLGPVVVAQKDRPVRVKFDNYLPKGTGGNLFLPVDSTVMGAGMGPDGVNGYSQDRATLHLHGGVTPWISDGTEHQWTTPAGVTETYPKGVSVGYVPDQWYDASGNPIPSCSEQTTCATAGASNDPGTGSMTFYYTNQESARLMFYHDHAYGITRLNVYSGQAAAYLVQDPAEAALVSAGTIPADQLPLVIEDKTFVPSPTQLAAEDPTWSTAAYGGYGSLWFPHVYMPNQNPGDASGANAMGRWDYGAWFWPPFTAVNGAVPNPRCLPTPPAPGSTPQNPGVYDCSASPGENAFNPGVPNPSVVPEAFMDTMTVNGTAYPTVQLEPKAYRLRILNASNDRSVNLQLYYAKSNASMWNPDGTLNDANAGEVPMVPAVQNGAGTAGYTFPDEVDGRTGGVPDSRNAGPAFIQIGTEGGFLSKPVVLPNRPVGFNYNRRDIVVLNVTSKTIMLGPAERADVIVDLSGVPAGSNLILYNDAPAPVPAFDSRYDYYTGDQDQVMTGGAPTTLPGYGPNTRTVMQIQVGQCATMCAGANLTALNAGIPAAVGQLQAAPVVPERGYDQAFGTTSPADPYVRIQAMAATFSNGTVTGLTITNPGSGYASPPTILLSGGSGSGARAYATLAADGLGTLTLTNPGSGYTAAPSVTISPPTGPGGIQATASATITTAPVTLALQPKGIQELFDPDYGRMNATMSVEIPNTNGTNQTTIPYGNIDPPTELVDTSGTNAVPTIPGGTVMAMLPDGTQIWKFTHNGVDTHSVHFHMFNIQLINRVGWDGAIRPPDPNEMGWKDTLRMNPLEDAIVAIKPIVPVLPWPLPNSIRPLAPTDAMGSSGLQYTNIDPAGLPVTVVNHLVNFGWEYVFHCHLLGHEENDMMRPIGFGVAPVSPSIGTATATAGQVTVTFTDNSPNETGFTIQRSTDGTTWADAGTVARLAPVWDATTQTVTDDGRSTGGILSFSETPPAGTYFYRVIANDVIGDTATAGFPSISIDSVPSDASAAVTP